MRIPSLVGHEALRQQLALPDAPRAILIEGPSGIGKSTVAREAALTYSKLNIVEVGNSICTSAIGGQGNHVHHSTCETTTTTVARHIVELARLRPLGGKRTVVLDAGRCTQDAANALLKVLEEPPAGTRFILHSSLPVLPTISSRCERLKALPLSDEEVEEVLTTMGVEPGHRERAARFASGRPGSGLHAANLLKHKGTTLQLLKAARDQDRALLANATRAFLPNTADEHNEARRSPTGDHTAASTALLCLGQGLAESRSGNFRLFDRSELESLQALRPQALDSILTTLFTPGRSHIRARAATEQLMAAWAKTERRT